MQTVNTISKPTNLSRDNVAEFLDQVDTFLFDCDGMSFCYNFTIFLILTIIEQVSYGDIPM